MLRVLHFSDIHVDVPWSEFPWTQMMNKRLIGAANLWLRRRRHFVDARAKLAALARFAREQEVDVVVCTGDYTALGTEPELRAARAAIEPLTRPPFAFVTVPGNHDVYLHDAVRDRRFERAFGDGLVSDWPESVVGGRFPAVRLFGDSLAVVTVDSVRPNPQPWRSSGRVPEAQLAALSRVLGEERLASRTVLVATHYAPRRRDGSRDRWLHGVENADALLHACAGHARTAVLHGHIHWRYHLRLPGLPPTFGAGSATHAGREGVWVYRLEGVRLRAVPGCWRPDQGAYRLDEDAAVSPWG